MKTTESTLQQYLTFRLGEEKYGINVLNIKEVLGVPRITRVPRMPSYLCGVINLRGNVIPVLDLKRKFALGTTEVTEDTSIIVTELPSFFHDDESEMMTIGIFSDGVEQVLDILEENISPPPKIGISIDTSFIHGMGRDKDHFVILLDLSEILTEAEFSSQRTMKEAAGE